MPRAKKDVLKELEAECSEDYSAPVKGAPSVSIYKEGKLVQEVSPDQLESWCKEHGYPYTVAKELVGKTWLNHCGYSFK